MRDQSSGPGSCLLLAIAAVIGGCSDSASGVDALEGVAPPAGQQAEQLMAAAEQAAANAAERNPRSSGAGAVPGKPSGVTGAGSPAASTRPTIDPAQPEPR